MLGPLLVGKILKMALRGKISEKAIKAIMVGLGDILVKSTKNDLDDEIWENVKKILLKK